MHLDTSKYYEYEEVRNPKWANEEQTLINCEVKFPHVDFEEWSPFTASDKDIYQHGRDIYAECLAGNYGSIAAFEGESPNARQKEVDEEGNIILDEPTYDPFLDN